MTDDQSAGATPVVPGATPGQNPPAPAPAAPTASGEPPMATDEGKRALEQLRADLKAERAAAKAAQAELESLRTTQMTDHEKAIAQARREAEAARDKTWSAMLRSSEVRRELQAAGIAGSIDLAARAPEFEALAIGEDGRVEGLDKAVAAFKSANPYLFSAPRPPAGNFDGGSGGSPALQTWTRDQIGSMSQAEYEKHEPEIMRAMREGRIRD